MYHFLFIYVFQSTLPREERPQPPNIANTTIRFQSTLPREERPQGQTIMFALILYFNPRSHERSDSQNNRRLGKRTKFQSTLPREERQGKRPGTETTGNFNPRSHERSDPRGSKLHCISGISIHAPTRGATEMGCYILIKKVFQSTLPREERRFLWHFCPCDIIFQSTLPREERQLLPMFDDISDDISIHAPTRGATNISPL